MNWFFLIAKKRMFAALLISKKTSNYLLVLFSVESTGSSETGLVKGT